MEIRVETEPIEFDTWGGPAPDPKWTYIDKAGHRHDFGNEEDRWPTLKRVVDRIYWCEECRDEHEDSHYECAQCGQTIEPGMMHRGPEHKLLPGPRRYFIDDVEVSEEEANAAVEEIRRLES